MRGGTVLAGLLLLATAAGAQTGSLTGAAERARRAWFSHDPAALFSSSPRVLIQLPGADPSAPVSRAQAAALLRDYVRDAEELETSVRTAREAGEGRGYVELARRYRVSGTQAVRTQALLLSYQLAGDSWVLVELRISG